MVSQRVDLPIRIEPAWEHVRDSLVSLGKVEEANPGSMDLVGSVRHGLNRERARYDVANRRHQRQQARSRRHIWSDAITAVLTVIVFGVSVAERRIYRKTPSSFIRRPARGPCKSTSSPAVVTIGSIAGPGAERSSAHRRRDSVAESSLRLVAVTTQASERFRMPRKVTAVLTVFAILVLAACMPSTTNQPPTSGILDTTGLTAVEVTIDAPVAPPYNHEQAKITSQSDLAQFRRSVVAHSISLRAYSAGSMAGCGGGANWTILIVRGNSEGSTLDVQTCGSAIRSNVAGHDLMGFLDEVHGLAGLQP